MNKLPRKTTAFALCLLLASAIGAAQSAASAETASSLETGWREVLDDGALEAGWLKSLGDPQLEEIVVEALLHNSQLTVASENFARAEQLALQAGAALAAAITVDGGANDISTAEPAGSLQWELDVWQRLVPATAVDYASPVAKTDLEAARQSLAAQTAKFWLLANETNLQLALSQQLVEIHQRILQIAQSHAAAGDAATADIEVVETGLAAARERQRRLVGALIHALRGLAVLIGRYPSAELAVVREYVPEPAAIPAGIAASLLERRADLGAAARGVASAFQQRQSAGIARLPRLPLTATGGVASVELQDLLAAGDSYFSRAENFLVSADNEPKLKIVSAQQREALEGYADIARRAFGEVASALDSDTRLAQHAALLATSTADIAARLATTSGGETAITADMLRLQLLALQSRIHLVRVQHSHLARRIDLHLALGGDFGD